MRNRLFEIRGAAVIAATFIVGATLAIYSPVGIVQPTTVKPGAADDLRTLYASADDVAEGQRVAEAACGRCHGVKGISNAKGVPHIAGQRAAYLYLEIQAYRSGARSDKPMEDAVKFMSDDALLKVSAYYASLPPAQPAATKGAKAAPAKDPVNAGKAAAAGCAGCHGEGGVSATAGTPSLVGLDPKYFAAAMAAYKSGRRKHELMKSLLSAVSDTDIRNLALYYGLQKPARARTPAPGNQAAGKEAAGACSGCHGERGVAANPDTPSLAGQDAQYFVASLQAYKDGSRGEGAMKGLAAALDDRAAKDVAAYYASLQPQAPKVIRPLSTAQLAQRCDRCHGVNGNSTDPRMPALAAQRQDYLDKVLHAYRTGARRSPSMAAMSDVLSESDVVNLAAHYAGQTARPVVYLLVPSK